MAKLKFKIATPERVVYESEADSVTSMTEMGEVTILPNHIPLVANLVSGEMKVVEEGQENFFVIHGGFLEVRTRNEVVILADAAERVEEIDIKRAEEAREKARKLMEEKIVDVEKFAEAQGALERSLARLKVGKRRKPPRIHTDISKDIGE